MDISPQHQKASEKIQKRKLSPRKRRTIIVLLLFILLAFLSSYLYRTQQDQLERDTLQDRMNEYSTKE